MFIAKGTHVAMATDNIHVVDWLEDFKHGARFLYTVVLFGKQSLNSMAVRNLISYILTPNFHWDNYNWIALPLYILNCLFAECIAVWIKVQICFHKWQQLSFYKQRHVMYVLCVLINITVLWVYKFIFCICGSHILWHTHSYTAP